jgi:hypothetical protein
MKGIMRTLARKRLAIQFGPAWSCSAHSSVLRISYVSRRTVIWINLFMTNNFAECYLLQLIHHVCVANLQWFRFILCQMSEKKRLKFRDHDRKIQAVAAVRKKQMGFKKSQKKLNVPKMSVKSATDLILQCSCSCFFFSHRLITSHTGWEYRAGVSRGIRTQSLS